MIKDIEKILKKALDDEEFNLSKDQILNNSIKVNANKNLDISDQNSICDYKLECYSNIFNLHFIILF